MGFGRLNQRGRGGRAEPGGERGRGPGSSGVQSPGAFAWRSRATDAARRSAAGEDPSLSCVWEDAKCRCSDHVKLEPADGPEAAVRSRRRGLGRLRQQRRLWGMAGLRVNF